jgi:hypothetical protein
MSIKLHLQSDWETVKERLKENNISLTDEDLSYEPGNEEKLLNLLSMKMKKSREEVAAYIESISANTDKAG